MENNEAKGAIDESHPVRELFRVYQESLLNKGTTSQNLFNKSPRPPSLPLPMPFLQTLHRLSPHWKSRLPETYAQTS